MADLTRSRNQIWITRSHLAALGFATLFIAVLSFLVGLQVGRSRSEVAVAEAPPPALPDPTSEDALDALLREVELAQSATPPATEPALTFPDTLTAAAPAPAPVPEGAEPQGAVAEAPVQDPPTAAAGAPATGWAVQVGSYPSAQEADARIEAVRAQGHAAYRVAALVDGTTWYRVRIGGFATRALAEEARLRLAEQLGSPDLLIAAAP